MNTARRALCGLALVAWVAAPPGLGQSESDASDEPQDLGLVERTERGLVQIDVSVSGPWDVISDLGAEDFRLAVQGVPITKLTVDRLCSEPSSGRRDRTAESKDADGETESSAGPRASYLLYFDQRMLTAAGRQNSIDIARRLVPHLIRDGSRGAIVSSGKKHETLVDLTDDVDQLSKALDRLEGDHDHWITYSQEEAFRIREVLDVRQHVGLYSACGTARRFQMEESWQTDKSLRVFSMTLGHLAGLDPPKVVFYFADTMRKNAGEHFLNYAGRCSVSDAGGAANNGVFGVEFAIDKVIEEAAAYGARVYTVRGEGLVATASPERRQAIAGIDPASVTTTTDHQRYAHAGDSLNGLAVETGGRSFIHGETPAKIFETVERDLGCIYLLSFNPGNLPQDQPLRVSLTTDRPKVNTHSRGRIVIQSDEARKTSELMAAFTAPGSVSQEVTLIGSIIPTGFDDGRYTALVQLRAPGSAINQAEWHFGASLLSRGEVKNSVSSSVKIDRSGVPVVFETEMAFLPGPFELILVGHEAVADQLGAGRIEGSWPVQQDEPTVGPIAVLQPADAAFVRDGETKRGGAKALAEDELVKPGSATALIGLVCRGAGKGKIQIARSLSGEGTHDFPPMEIEFGKERCAQIRDLIPEMMMTTGRFVYRVQIRDGERVVAEAERTFNAIDPGANEGTPDGEPDGS